MRYQRALDFFWEMPNLLDDKDPYPIDSGFFPPPSRKQRAEFAGGEFQNSELKMAAAT
jgi:hypothetical protein